MDSPAVVLENSSCFLFVPLGLELFLLVLLLHNQILSAKTHSCFTPQFWWHFSIKMGHIVEYAQLYKKNKKCVDFHKDVSHMMMFHKDVSHLACQKICPTGMPKICFVGGFFSVIH